MPTRYALPCTQQSLKFNLKKERLIRLMSLRELCVSDTENQLQPFDQTNDFFGGSVLMIGEDEGAYARLRAALVEEIKPKTPLEWIRVTDLTNMYWQEQRCKANAVSLMDSVYVEACKILIGPFIQKSMIDQLPYFLVFTRHQGDADVKNAMALALAEFGITEGQIRAKQMQLCSRDLHLIDRMIVFREAERRRLRKEIEKESRAKESAAFRASAVSSEVCNG